MYKVPVVKRLTLYLRCSYDGKGSHTDLHGQFMF